MSQEFDNKPKGISTDTQVDPGDDLGTFSSEFRDNFDFKELTGKNFADITPQELEQLTDAIRPDDGISQAVADFANSPDGQLLELMDSVENEAELDKLMDQYVNR